MCCQYLFNERSYDMFRGDPGGDALSPVSRALAFFFVFQISPRM